jgi:hypothetical protein
LQDGQEMGLLVENMAAAHLQALAQQTQVRLHHWRDQRDEVDLIYDAPGEPIAFELASSAGHSRRGLHALLERFPKFRGRCFLVAPGAPHRAPGVGGDPVGTLSLDLFLVAVGQQAAAELAKRLRP